MNETLRQLFNIEKVEKVSSINQKPFVVVYKTKGDYYDCKYNVIKYFEKLLAKTVPDSHTYKIIPMEDDRILFSNDFDKVVCFDNVDPFIKEFVKRRYGTVNYLKPNDIY